MWSIITVVHKIIYSFGFGWWRPSAVAVYENTETLAKDPWTDL